MSESPLHTALERLTEAARRQVESHPWGHLVAGRRETVQLTLELPLDPRDADHAREHATQALQDAVQALLLHRAVFRPGRVFCLRCASAECEHSLHTDSRHIFTGYGSTGLPRFQDFGQWLLARKDPRVDGLYASPPRFVTEVLTTPELTADLLPAFADPADVGFRLHGQVVAGWYSLPGADGSQHAIALTLQVVSSQPQGQQRRFGLNILAVGPDTGSGNETLENLYDRLGGIPWTDTVRWGQTALASIEGTGRGTGKGTGNNAGKGTGTKGQGASKKAKAQQRRIDGLLQALARRLDKQHRGRGRRTQHAEQRHNEGDRPTRMALADAREADRHQLLFDPRRETLVVLGPRGRVHVFSLEGKLVTSVRYSPAAIDRRRERDLWRPATDEQVATLEKHLGTLGAAATL